MHNSSSSSHYLKEKGTLQANKAEAPSGSSSSGPDSARKALELGAMLGDADNQAELAERYEEEGNHKRAAHWYRLAAMGGNSNAQYMFGRYCADEKQMEGSRPLAARWYHSAAKQGHRDAQYQLALSLSTEAQEDPEEPSAPPQKCHGSKVVEQGGKARACRRAA
ncbi:hypothetical protein BH10PSE19_BH10PSE19_18580 [soil metagenome]